MGAERDDVALETYESFAEIYDDFNHRNDYEMWLGRKLLPELERRGLRRGRALDVGCGTGRAFAPLLARGWRVHGCDISPAMVVRARERFGDAVTVDVADMRELPVFGAFELVVAMNDAVNYLIGEGELELALRGMRANLAADGLLMFDCNSKLTVQLAYEPMREEVEKGGRRWTWTGLGRADPEQPVYQVRIEGDGVEPFVNHERYYRIEEVEAAIAAAELEPVAVLGQREEGEEVVLRETPDDLRDHKIVYITRARCG